MQEKAKQRNRFYPFFLSIFIFVQCVTTAKIPVVESAPPNFYETMKGARSLGIFVDDIPNSSEDDWKKTIHSGIESALNDFKYFKIVDIHNRSQRLKEMSFAQKMGDEIRSLGSELSVQALLYVQIPEPPQYDCKLSSSSKKETSCVLRDKDGKCLKNISRNIITYEKTLRYTILANAKLIHISSGQMLVASNSEPAILTNRGKSMNISCPSRSEAHLRAIQIASNNIANTISPRVRPFSIPLFTSAVGVKDEDRIKEVESYLKRGNSWVNSDNPNFEFAKKDWELALSKSKNTSANAFWNLAIFYWQNGEIPKAEEFFQYSIENGGADFFDSTWENFKLIFRNKRRDVINKFYEEKKRYELENS
ncbi:MAG TPA: hypothetical protein PK079_18135 [Leptospiraceae bacterium]|nr:hypothetical protein [Leptospiraceae bacterium]HMX33621.1 hypothetical protein [Leptospiraceae bacterium]HMY33784.1 hypothetical protein [Leptospiraceae bacterium]HMZ64842.1 hypothetical protein [Leptospiraceae bacterium]HNA10147.1 hypothetical protein [Leptospiraceae bacterium]